MANRPMLYTGSLQPTSVQSLVLHGGSYFDRTLWVHHLVKVLKNLKPSLRIVCCFGEHFLDNFENHYKQLEFDVLIVEDVQEVPLTSGTNATFFHTIDTLKSQGTCVILTASSLQEVQT